MTIYQQGHVLDNYQRKGRFVSCSNEGNCGDFISRILECQDGRNGKTLSCTLAHCLLTLCAERNCVTNCPCYTRQACHLFQGNAFTRYEDGRSFSYVNLHTKHTTRRHTPDSGLSSNQCSPTRSLVENASV